MQDRFIVQRNVVHGFWTDRMHRGLPVYDVPPATPDRSSASISVSASRFSDGFREGVMAAIVIAPGAVTDWQNGDMFRRKAKGRDLVTRHTAPVAASEGDDRDPGVEYHTGSVIHPEEGAAFRIDSAADIDPNIRTYGRDGIPRGGAGGYGGAGTK